MLVTGYGQWAYTHTSTKEAIKTAYESNLNTNAYTDAEVQFIDVATALTTTNTTLPSGINELKSITDTLNAGLATESDRITAEISTRSTNEGTLTNLTTTAKSDLVSSINEVLGNLNTHEASIAAHGVTEVVGAVDTQTLTNKTITSSTNTVAADYEHTEVTNSTGSTLPKYSVVTIDTVQNLSITSVKLQSASTEMAVGITLDTIAAGATGRIAISGTVIGIDTSSWVEGTLLYSDGTGGLTPTKATSGSYQSVATVTVSGVPGKLLVNFKDHVTIASATTQGVVKLVDNVTTASAADALTAKQGKLLNDRLAVVESTYISSGTTVAATSTTNGSTVSITGDVVGTTNVATNGDISVPVQVVDNSHNHVISNVTGLQTALNNKFDKAGGTISGNLTIAGNLTISGGTTTVSSTTVTTADNVITVNAGEAGAGVTAGKAGIEVDRGTATNYTFIFDEASGTFRAGTLAATQPVATREDAPLANGIAVWDSTTFSFKTTATPTVTSLTATSISVSGTVNGRDIAIDGAKLDTIAANATGDQLASQVPYTNTASALTATNVQAALDEVEGNVSTHKLDTANPHNVTKTQLGLGNVDNTADTAKNVLSATKWTTARTISVAGSQTGTVVLDGTANATLTLSNTPSNLMADIKTVDGTGSGLDADLLDGKQGVDYEQFAIDSAMAMAIALA